MTSKTAKPLPREKASTPQPRYFATADEFRDWLRAQGATATELLVGFHKVGSGRPSLTWPQSVDEALCVGWIDGVRRRIDDTAYSIRFTPRKKNSNWSSVNIARVQALIAQGRMTAAGLAAFERRSDARSGIYAYEQAHPVQLSAEQVQRFQQHPPAWSWFEAQASSYRRVMTHWVVSAKQEATRARRLDKLIASAAAGVRWQP